MSSSMTARENNLIGFGLIIILFNVLFMLDIAPAGTEEKENAHGGGGNEDALQRGD